MCSRKLHARATISRSWRLLCKAKMGGAAALCSTRGWDLDSEQIVQDFRPHLNFSTGQMTSQWIVICVEWITQIYLTCVYRDALWGVFNLVESASCSDFREACRDCYGCLHIVLYLCFLQGMMMLVQLLYIIKLWAIAILSEITTIWWYDMSNTTTLSTMEMFMCALSFPKQ